MAEIAPFRALRFAQDPLDKVLAPPYDVIDAKQRELLGDKSPHNIVHLDLPEGEGDARYENAKQRLASWIAEGVLARDSKPSFLRYEQTFEPPEGGAPITRKGFFALVRAEQYDKRVVLPHERTLSGPKEDRYKLFCATATALSPVFLLYEDKANVVAGALRISEAEEEIKTDDGIISRFARVTDKASIAAIEKALSTSSLLIADGHHRYETTLRYGTAIDEERAKKGLPPAPDGAHHFVLAFLADANDPGLLVFPTHRVVYGLAAVDREKFLADVKSLFDIRYVTEEPGPGRDSSQLLQLVAEAGKSSPSFAVYFKDKSKAILSLRKDANIDAHPALSRISPALRRTDVVLLHTGILESVLGITREQQASQAHLRYWKQGGATLADVSNGDGQIAFLMNGTPVADVRRSCEAGEVMPQKSTFFYPKVPTGLVLHRLDPEETIEF
ncbi:MAG: DUF1015 domain-containing protein [Sandaracinaceae bacterium]|jgi:uncharacterized protein (DUF1015 family)|nr:DUF1015 domain-containing protein [Sandaracinaceae bacterium]